VTYGTSSGSQAYGNPNVGSSSTTSYTVTGLSGGTTYYFRVRAGNGCMPGDYSNERSTTPSGGFIAGVAPGFEEGVLGEMTSAKEESISKNSKQIGDTNTDNILGVETNQTKKSNYNYIIASLLLVVIVGGVTIYLKRRKNSKNYKLKRLSKIIDFYAYFIGIIHVVEIAIESHMDWL